MLRNGGAEYGTVEGWRGLENLRRGEFGLRHGVGRTGDYAFCWHGQSRGIVESEWVPVDPAKSYRLSGYFKGDPGEFAGVTFGVVMADAQQRQIRPYHVCSMKGTLTELAAPCRAGDRILCVKNAARWQSGGRFAAAFGVGENELTFDVTPLGINDVRTDGDDWVVALNKPCGLDFPAGTLVVQNRTGNGGLFFPGTVNADIPAEWTEKSGEIRPGKWWAGTAYAKVVIVGPGLRRATREPELPALLMDDFSLRIVE